MLYQLSYVPEGMTIRRPTENDERWNGRPEWSRTTDLALIRRTL